MHFKSPLKICGHEFLYFAVALVVVVVVVVVILVYLRAGLYGTPFTNIQYAPSGKWQSSNCPSVTTTGATRSYFSEGNSVSFPLRYSKAEKAWDFDILCMRSPGV